MRPFALSLAAAGLAMAMLPWLHAEGVISAPITAGRVYPNPWRSDRHAHFLVTFDGLPGNATVRLFTLSGREVRVLGSDANGKCQWDRMNKQGQSVASGIYLYSVSDASGRTSLGKIAIIR